MASGVGPAATLHQHDILVTADRPGLGQNMEDHVYFALSYRVNAPTFSSLNNVAFTAQEAKNRNENASGLYPNTTTDVLGWEKVPEPVRSTMSNDMLATLATYPEDWPEIEYLVLGAYLGYQQNLVEADLKDGYIYASVLSALCAPRSRGNVTIASADALVPTVISPNWLTDIEVLIAGFKRVRQFWQSEAMQPFIIGEDAFPDAALQTDAEIEQAIRQGFSTVYHASCTCAMGRPNDTMAVVDSLANVIGVQGLRVVDAAAFPFLVPGHPQSTVYALAEKMACEISGSW